MQQNSVYSSRLTLEQIKHEVDPNNRVRNLASLLDYALRQHAIQRGVEDNKATLGEQVRNQPWLFRDSAAVLKAVQVRNALTHPDPLEPPPLVNDIANAERILTGAVTDVCAKLPEHLVLEVSGNRHGLSRQAALIQRRNGIMKIAGNGKNGADISFGTLSNSIWFPILPILILIVLVAVAAGTYTVATDRPAELERAAESAAQSTKERPDLNPAFVAVDAAAREKYDLAQKLDASHNHRMAREAYEEVVRLNAALDTVAAAETAHDAIVREGTNELLDPLEIVALDAWGELLQAGQRSDVSAMLAKSSEVTDTYSLYHQLQAELDGACAAFAAAWDSGLSTSAPSQWREACLGHARALEEIREGKYDMALKRIRQTIARTQVN